MKKIYRYRAAKINYFKYRKNEEKYKMHLLLTIMDDEKNKHKYKIVDDLCYLNDKLIGLIYVDDWEFINGKLIKTMNFRPKT